MIYLDSGATTLEKPRPWPGPWLRQWGRCPLRDGETIRHPKRRPGRPMIAGKRRQELIPCTGAGAGDLHLQCHLRPEHRHPDSGASGCRVAVSGYEHNAVTRVLHSIRRVEIMVADAPPFRPDQILGGLHSPAVGSGCGDLQPRVQCVRVRAAGGGTGGLCRKIRHTPLIVDASQSAGIRPVRWRIGERPLWLCRGTRALWPSGDRLLLCGRGSKSAALTEAPGSASRIQTMPTICRTGWRRGRTTCRVLRGYWKDSGLSAMPGMERIAQWESWLTQRAAEGL